MTDTPPIRVLIVDDHPMVRSGLKLFIAGSQEIVLAGEASSGAEAVEFCRHDSPDVILMDMVMPEMDGSEATRQIVELNSQVKIIILTSFHEQDLVENALRAGAMSYPLRDKFRPMCSCKRSWPPTPVARSWLRKLPKP